MTDEINDVRIIGLITVLVLFGIAMLGMDWESKVGQNNFYFLIYSTINIFPRLRK